MDPPEPLIKRPKLSMDPEVEDTFEDSIALNKISPLEKLPAELVWKIIHLVPDSWLAFRLVCVYVICWVFTNFIGMLYSKWSIRRVHGPFQTSSMLHKRVTEYAFLRPDIQGLALTIFVRFLFYEFSMTIRRAIKPPSKFAKRFFYAIRSCSISV